MNAIIDQQAERLPSPMQYADTRAGMHSPANDNGPGEIKAIEAQCMLFAVNVLNEIVQTSETLPRERLMTVVDAITAFRDPLSEHCINRKPRG